MFAKFMQAITPHIIGSGNPQAVLTEKHLADIAVKLGLIDTSGNGQVAMLQHREDLIPTFGQWVNHEIQQINAARA
jgi:hypothetical protein